MGRRIVNIPKGQEHLVAIASKLIEAYGKDEGRIYLAQLQLLMSSMIPFFPSVANALALLPGVQRLTGNWCETGSVDEQLLSELWVESTHPPIGRA